MADLQQQLKWTGDAVEQIADYLNELAGQSQVDPTGRARYAQYIMTATPPVTPSRAGAPGCRGGDAAGLRARRG